MTATRNNELLKFLGVKDEDLESLNPNINYSHLLGKFLDFINSDSKPI